jgi:ATP-dependent RNA helicase DDX24/MAK5
MHCLESERDPHLYYLLARHPGRALVFVNAVSAVRRLAALLQLLGLPAVALHAQQQQRQRLKALDRCACCTECAWPRLAVAIAPPCCSWVAAALRPFPSHTSPPPPRLRCGRRFKAAPHGVLVATDVAARGLDISDVQVCVLCVCVPVRPPSVAVRVVCCCGCTWACINSSLCRTR